LGTTSINVLFNNTGGTVNGNSGTLAFNGGGTVTGSFVAGSGAGVMFGGGAWDLNTGTSISGAGTVSLSSTVNFNAGSYNVAGTTVINGNAIFNTAAATNLLNLTGNVGGPATLTVSGLFTWSGGSLSEGGTIQANGGMLINGETTWNSPHIINNAGVANWTGGNFRTGGGATFNNEAAGTVNTNFDGIFYNWFGGGQQFNNVGTFTKSAGGGATTFSGAPFTNSGTVNANSGTIGFYGGYTQTAGVLSLNGGNVAVSPSFIVQSGQVVGSGNISGTFNNTGGTISPGFSVGTLTFDSNLTFGATSSYTCEVNSTTGTADKIVANGVGITPGSTVALSEIGTGAVSVPLTIIDNTSGSAITGQFSNLADTSIITVGTNRFKVNYSGSGPSGGGNDLVLEPLSVSGTITYGNAIGNPAPPRFVKNVSVASTSGSPAVGPIITGTPGTYTIAGFGTGSYTLKPTKSGGSTTAITSNDAARIAQGVSGAQPFVSNNQRFAADTSGNGGVSSQDAAKIAQFVAGVTPLPAPNFTGQWRFFTSDLPAFPAGSHPQERNYASVPGSLTGEDYIGILIGEVSGNWNPATHPRPGAGPERSIEVGLAQSTVSTDKEIVIPINVEGIADKNIVAYQFELRYDPSVMQPLAEAVDLKGTASRGFSVVTNAAEPGLLRVVVYGPMPIDENGVLLNLRFTAVGAAGSVSPLTFERIMFNEGEATVSVTDGRIELF